MAAEQERVLKKSIIDNDDDMEIHLRLFLNGLHSCDSHVVIDCSGSSEDDD